MRTYAFIALTAACLFCSASPESRAQDISPPDFSAISPSDFSDDELDLPYYLAHFHVLANSVRMSEPRRGFIDIAVWRSPERNVPRNARIMENVLALAYFYTTRRPWNPYFGHAGVRDRLEAALEYWLRLQLDDGSFTLDDSGEPSMSPTAFATKFMGETIRLLNGGPEIDPGLLERVVEADRRALVAVLTRDEFYRFGRRFANQYTNVYAGALAYLDLFPDSAIRRLLEDKMEEIGSALQSPAGYYYEHGGPDWTYDIETHHSNHRTIWHHLRGTPDGEAYADHVRLWYAWLADNAVLEPDTSGFSINHGLETRLSFRFYRENHSSIYSSTCSPLAEVVETARAFCESNEERERRLIRERQALERSWPNVPPLEVGTFAAYSPYAFLHRSHYKWFPSDSQKTAARRRLPYLRSESYTRVRSDDRHHVRVLLVRRPTYYAAFSSGESLTPQQRYGLGLLWEPHLGTVLQSQSGSALTWGTRSRQDGNVHEAAMPDASLTRDRNSPGVHDLEDGEIAVTYQLGDAGNKRIRFLSDEVVGTINHPGRFTESFPLLVASDQHVAVANSRAVLRSEVGGFEIQFSEHADASLEETDRRVGRKRVVMLRLESSDELTYRLRFGSLD